MTTRKEKLSDNPQVNFNHSKEIVYWSNKFKISPETFQKVFIDNEYSISKTLSFCNSNYTTHS